MSDALEMLTIVTTAGLSDRARTVAVDSVVMTMFMTMILMVMSRLAVVVVVVVVVAMSDSSETVEHFLRGSYSVQKCYKRHRGAHFLCACFQCTARNTAWKLSN